MATLEVLGMGWTGDRIDPYSAGIEAYGMIAHAVRVMREAGVGKSTSPHQHRGPRTGLFIISLDSLRPRHRKCP